jgi:hypothetical protein
MKSVILYLAGKEEQVEKIIRFLADELEVFPYSSDLCERAEEMQIIAKVLEDMGRGLK